MSERVVLLAVDGLDWQRLRAGVAAGRLPHLAELLAQGAHAEVAVSPCVPGLTGAENGLNSPTLWTTVATGQYYFTHGVYDFTNLLDNVEQPPLFESRHVAAPRIWDVLGTHDHGSIVVGYYVTHPAVPLNGVMVSDLFGETAGTDVVWPGARCDALAGVLGATSYADYVRTTGVLGTEAGVREARGATSGDGPLAGQVRAILERFTRLAPDEIEHLLAEDVSPRRRLLEYRLVYPYVRDERLQRLFLTLLEQERWSFATVYYRLIDFVSHGFWVAGHTLGEAFVRAYGEVVDRAYAWIDACIGAVRTRLDRDDRLIVLSDHGFTTNEGLGVGEGHGDVSTVSYGRHAEPAVLLVSGAARRGAVPDVTLLDIAPSIYDYFGIPQAETLDGGPVPGLLHDGAPRVLPRVASYPYRRPTAAAAMSEDEQQQVQARLAALGYLDE